MFFILSKTAGFLTVPSNLLISMALLGVLLMPTRYARTGRRLVVVAVLAIAGAGWTPLGSALIAPLENRFPQWDDVRGAPDGVVILGGALGPAMTAARGQPALNESAERITVAAELARRFPDARIVYSGGDGTLSGEGGREAELARPLLESFGIRGQRIVLENASRNTHENAMLTKALVDPKPGERWLLVTSAHHMPRSVGCFRRAGFPVEPYPVDWRTPDGPGVWRPFGTLSGGLARTDVAVREWVGLVAYWLTGRTSELFPGP
jgi:uncharacterized SAM-binding protein YcdF (DUF218 family)